MRDYFASVGRPLTYSRLLYLLLGLPLGVFYFVFLAVTLSVAGSLVVIIVGIPLLALTIMGWRGLAAFERRLVTRLIGVPVSDPPNVLHGVTGFVQKTRAVITDSATWRSLAWLLLRFPLGIIGFTVGVTLTAPVVALVIVPLATVAAADVNTSIDLPSLGIWFWAMPVVGVLLAPAFAHLINGLASIEAGLARALLGPTSIQRTAALTRRTTVLEERTRLAHELHDSVGHTLTMIVVQAGAGRHVFDRDPQFARTALENIETSGRRALDELDRILGILRAEDGESTRAPQPGLDRVQSLVDDTAAAGLDVTLAVEGDIDEVPAPLSRTAYRIVQEGLTNVVKHAGPVRTTVTVHSGAGRLEVEVRNDPGDGNGTITEGGGRGLAGIRERVITLGGRVEAGPRPEGGYRLWAQLPMDGG